MMTAAAEAPRGKSKKRARLARGAAQAAAREKKTCRAQTRKASPLTATVTTKTSA